MSSDQSLRINDLCKSYGGAPVLDGFSLRVAPGEFVALLGPSGAGKTTLLRCVAGLIAPDSGEIMLGRQPMHLLTGAALRRARHDIGFVFQQFNLVRRRTALGNVLTGRLSDVALWRIVLGRFPDADRRAAFSALERVGLLDQAWQRADSLSGGQQQRVAIARALVQRSRLMLADEPVASLDPAAAESVLSLLREVAREHEMSVLCSLHQPALAERYADRICAIAAARGPLTIA
ncbi:MAG: phosphonate ABC transporter ATP-binding protein [Beijerinckiaceae bacterium]|nr:phosphonate ABC transporter ATP-binding protein [Beijerinckiaceae bacterium]